MMRCERCDEGDRLPVLRSKVAERDGRVAVVIGIPMEECPSCGERWMSFETATRLDELFRELLRTGAEIASRHFVSAPAA